MQASGFCLVLLSPQQESFFKLAEAAQEVHRQLKQPGVSQVCPAFTKRLCLAKASLDFPELRLAPQCFLFVFLLCLAFHTVVGVMNTSVPA